MPAADFDRQPGAVGAGLLLGAAADRQRVGAAAAGVAAGAERQTGNDPRRAVVVRQQMAPPRIGIALLRHRQDPDRSVALGHGADHLADRAIDRHRRVAAVMVAGEIPETLRFGRGKNRDRERGFEPHGSRQHLAPDAHDARHRQRAAVAGGEPAQDLSLARGLVERRIAVLLADCDFLGGCDPADDISPLDQQIMQPVIDLVDVPAQICEIGRDDGHGLVRGRGVVVCRSPIGRNQRKR